MTPTSRSDYTRQLFVPFDNIYNNDNYNYNYNNDNNNNNYNNDNNHTFSTLFWSMR